MNKLFIYIVLLIIMFLLMGIYSNTCDTAAEISTLKEQIDTLIYN